VVTRCMGYPTSPSIAAVADATTSTSPTATAGTTRPASGPSADRRVVEYPDVDKREKSNAHQSLLQRQMARWPGFGMPSPPEAEQEANECAPRGGRAGRAGRHQSSKDRRERHRLVRLELSRSGTVWRLRVSFEGVVAAATPSGRPRARRRPWSTRSARFGPCSASKAGVVLHLGSAPRSPSLKGDCRLTVFRGILLEGATSYALHS